MQNQAEYKGQTADAGQQILSPTLEERGLASRLFPRLAFQPERRDPRGDVLGGQGPRVEGRRQLSPHDIEAEFLDARLSVEPSADDADLFSAIQAADPILSGFHMSGFVGWQERWNA